MNRLPIVDHPLTDWLLAGDPAVRWQVLQDVLDAPAQAVAAERARVATEGLGAEILAAQAADGTWAGVAWNGDGTSTMHALLLLRELGLDPASPAAQAALTRVRELVHWQGWDIDGVWQGIDVVGAPYFIGEVEPCINGQVAVGGAYFGQDVQRIIDRLLTEQLPDGGWNCEAPNNATVSSFHTTICVLEALLEYELAGGARSAETAAARLRGHEYLLERGLLRSRSTGAIIDDDWLRPAFPCWWHYDILRALEYLRRAGTAPDPRAAEAIALLEARRDASGRWPLEQLYPGLMLETEVDQPSRWNTLRALRVLMWWHSATP